MILCVQHDVGDFESWKVVFDRHDDSRKQYGSNGHRVLRRGDRPNSVMVLTEFPDRGAAEAFVADPSLGAAMARAGVEGVADISFWEDAEELVSRPTGS